MSYSYKGKTYSINSPIKSISVNKQNVVVTDQKGSQLIQFASVNESKAFLAWAYQA